MSGWLKALLGVEEREIPADAVTRFEFANLPRGSAALVMLLVAAALIFAVFWIYRREGSVSGRVKIALATLRSLVIAAAFLLVLEPVLAVDQVSEIEKSTVVLLDESLSMTVRDRYRAEGERYALSNAFNVDPSELKRYELVNAALRASGLAEALARNNEVRVFTFSDAPAPLLTLPRLAPGATAAPLPPLDPESPERRRRAARGTNLSAAVRGALDEIGSERTAAVVLITDGRHTIGPPAEDLGVFLKNKDIPLHTVLVGRDEAMANLRAVSLAGPDRAYRNDPVRFQAQVSSRTLPVATVLFERRYVEKGEDWQPVDRRDATFLVDDQPVDLEFSDRPPDIGPVEYRIRMEPQPEESTPRDNEKSFLTRVVEERAKVLFVAGGPGHEYYAIKNVLLRDNTVQLACFLQSADPEFPQDGNDLSLRQLPADEKGLFFFDVVLLYDPNGERFPPGFEKLLGKFVEEHRGGLGVIAGNKYTLALLRRAGPDNPVADMLPVVLDLDRADLPGQGIGYGRLFTDPWRMEPTPEATTHPITRFRADVRTVRELVWDNLPPFYWFFPTLRPKPGARVLAVNGDPRERVEPYGPRPMLATHRYGGGNVMFLAADETWRWRSIAEDVFDRFWVQTVRFLLEGRLAGERKRFRIFVDKEVVDLGDSAHLQVEAYTPQFEPYEADVVGVVVDGPDDFTQEVALLPVPGKPGRYSGSFAPPSIGDFELRAKDAQFRAAGESSDNTPGATFLVIEPDLEMGNVRADEPLLKDLAARTRGRFVPLSSISRLADPKTIPPASERVVTQGRPIPLWDTWTTIVVILLLLCAEWILRKKYRMV